MDTCGLCFEKCGWHEPITSRMKNGFQLNFVQRFNLNMGVSQRQEAHDLTWALCWGWWAEYRCSEEQSTLYATPLPDPNLLPRSRMLDVTAQTYIYHVRVLQLDVAVKSESTVLSTSQIYPPGSHTMAQCLARGHMAVDWHISCGSDQTCDLFYDRTIYLTSGPPGNNKQPLDT